MNTYLKCRTREELSAVVLIQAWQKIQELLSCVMCFFLYCRIVHSIIVCHVVFTVE
jgi:hypothetical protein